MSSFEIGVLIFLTYLCVYSIILRICKTKENIEVTRSIGKMDSHMLNKMMGEFNNERQKNQ